MTHHLAFEVDDLAAACARLADARRRARGRADAARRRRDAGVLPRSGRPRARAVPADGRGSARRAGARAGSRLSRTRNGRLGSGGRCACGRGEGSGDERLPRDRAAWPAGARRRPGARCRTRSRSASDRSPSRCPRRSAPWPRPVVELDPLDAVGIRVRGRCLAARRRAARSNQSGYVLTTRAVSLCGQGGSLAPVRRRRHRAVVASATRFARGRRDTDGEHGDGDCDDE